MITTTFDKGMIFLCNDNCPKTGAAQMKHNYIVFGCTPGPLGLVQAMSITSMTNKDVKMEVPIKLCNDYVSYIVPYNLHSLKQEAIELHNYKGTIVDTPRISKDEFMNLLRDLYLDHIGLGSRDHVSVVADYNEYCRKFWEEFKDVPEFRERKQLTSAISVEPVTVASGNDEPSDEEVTAILNSVVRNTHENIVASDISAVCDPSTSSYRSKGKKKKGKKARKQQKMEARKINREMHDAVGHTVDSTVTESTIPYMEEPFPTKITPETVKKLVDAPRMLKDWDNELLVLFLNAYDHYGSTKLHTVVHDRWKSSQTLYQVKMSVMTEMKKRGVGYEPTVDPLSRPMRQWTTQELAGFANLMENHRYDAAFKLSYTGFDSVQKCNQLATRVRNELKKRTSDAVAVS